MKQIDKGKLRDTAIDNAGGIGMAMLILVAVVGSIVIIEVNRDGVVNWAKILYNATLGLVAFACARRQGIVKGSKVEAHVENRRQYGLKISALVNNGGIDHIEEFCRYRTKLREQEMRENIMLKVCISPAKFAELQKLTDEERTKLLNKKQLKAYTKATGKIKVRPVSPRTILADIESNDYSLDVVATSKLKDFADYMAKVVPSVILPVAIAFIEIAGAQGEAIEIIFGITMKLFILASSFISGSTSGLNKASYKNNIILNRIYFLALYETWRAANKVVANPILLPQEK